MTEAAPVAEHRTEAARAEERAHTSVREYIESLLVTVILALFGTTFVVQAFKIPSQSMEPEWADQIFKYIQNGQIVVPAGNYFAMGDNRDHSWDSRYWGFVNRDAIMGGPVVIYWSIQSSEEEYSDRSFGGGLVGILRTLIEIPTRTRWNRMLRTVH